MNILGGLIFLWAASHGSLELQLGVASGYRDPGAGVGVSPEYTMDNPIGHMALVSCSDRGPWGVKGCMSAAHDSSIPEDDMGYNRVTLYVSIPLN